MAKRLYVWLVVAALAGLALLIFSMRSALNHPVPQADRSAAENLTVTIDEQRFVMKDGVAELDAAPGSAAKNTLRIIGDPVSGDVTGDGKPDSALLLRNEPGGSGTFYYAVLAVNDGGAYHASNMLALGDRIVPKGVEFADRRFVYRFLERKPGEPMAAEPTVEATIVVQFDQATGRISALS